MRGRGYRWKIFSFRSSPAAAISVSVNVIYVRSVENANETEAATNCGNLAISLRCAHQGCHTHGHMQHAAALSSNRSLQQYCVGLLPQRGSVGSKLACPPRFEFSHSHCHTFLSLTHSLSSSLARWPKRKTSSKEFAQNYSPGHLPLQHLTKLHILFALKQF